MATSYLDKLYESFGKLFVRTINGQKPDDAGNVEIIVTGGDSNGIPKVGNRGELAGFESAYVNGAPDNFVINQDSADVFRMNGDYGCNVIVEQGVVGTSWTKTVFLKRSSFYQSGGISISLGNGWAWVNDELPAVENNSLLVLHWCNDVGIASMVTGTPIKAGIGTFTFDNPDETLTANVTPKGYAVSIDGPFTYSIFGTGTIANCQIAVGDKISIDGSFRSKMVTTSSKITIDSTGVVTDVQDGFKLVLYDED